jgi:hypothetical protein
MYGVHWLPSLVPYHSCGERVEPQHPGSTGAICGITSTERILVLLLSP